MRRPIRKILVIRFSSIGDIVLTTPVVRSLKQGLPECEVHVLTKAAYRDLYAYHPQIDGIHVLEDSLRSTVQKLKRETFDLILDLHNNLRSLRIRLALMVPSSVVDKKNLHKYLMVRKSGYPSEWLPHIVTRYGKTLQKAGVQLDNGGLDLFYPAELDQWANNLVAPTLPDSGRLGVVLGAKFRTKRWLPAYFIETLNRLQRPIILIGGADAQEERNIILPELQVPVFDGIQTYSLLQSTALLNLAADVLTHDTGFMHIAAALGKPVYSIWGNTVPALGMTPYKTTSVILENQALSCRPCSKIGYQACPKGHFKCMRDLTPDDVVTAMSPRS